MIKWLEETFVWYDSTHYYSVRRDAHLRWVNKCITIAAKADQLDIVKYLYGHRLHDRNDELLYCAAKSGQLAVVQWLFKRKAHFVHIAIERAAEGDHLEIVQWLHTQMQLRHHEATKKRSERGFSINIAAKHGSLELVEWLCINRPSDYANNAMNNPAARGRIDIIECLHDNKVEGCSVEALHGAIQNGHLNMVVWLKDHRFEFTEWTAFGAMYQAACNGQLEIIKWLFENKYGEYLLCVAEAAISRGFLEVLKILFPSGCQGSTSIDQNLKWVDCLSSLANNEAAVNGHYGVVRCLFKNGFREFTPETMKKTVVAGHTQIVRFLHQHCNMRCDQDTITQALHQKNFAVVEWLIKNDPNVANYKYVSVTDFVASKRITSFLRCKQPK